MPRLLRADVVALGIVAAIVVVLAGIAPLGFEVHARQAVTPTVGGTVLRVLSDRTDAAPQGTQRTRTLEVDIGGKAVTVQEVTAPGQVNLVPPQPGERVLLQSNPGPNGDPQYYIVDHVRSTVLVLTTALFAALVLVVGRWYGVRSILGLVATYLILMRFILPGILSGHSPLVISLIGGIAIMASTLVLAHGADLKSGAAVGGTALALIIIVTLSQVAIAAARFTGLVGDENATNVFVLFGGAIDARGLLLSGILIGALGALDDVTMTQSSTVFELRDANPVLRTRALYQRGMRVGRDHIASIVNTLVLAYAGASLPLLVILASQTEGAGTLLNREFLASEVVRTVVGSIGIVAAVPLTTLLAAIAAGSQPPGPVGSPPAPAPREVREEHLEAIDLLRNLRPPRPDI